ncbi:hypothetical protein QOZ80_2AG0108810 [Eleusine coracana subsp. coracana]|nr:hypothetical protein QOZ80_2AG0108680 [Eleusine coracana subsp. coracana]KAK3156560.1 hypothetical protein QOZ80_2AG0108810 [Eleusine coracana subsp. coracana]
MPSRVRLEDTGRLQFLGATPRGRVAFTSPSWKAFDVFLINPVTGASQAIQLDGLSTMKHTKEALLLTGGSSDSLAFCALDVDSFLIWRRATNNDDEWTFTSLAMGTRRPGKILSATECNGRFYLLHNNGYVYMIDATVPPPLCMVIVPVKGRNTYYREGFLLESDGEILFVLRLRDKKLVDCFCIFCDRRKKSESVIVGFEVYMLDAKDKRWTKVEELAGDQALFVGQESSFALRAPETVGYKSNCVYFIGKNKSCSLCGNFTENTWGTYSLEDGKILFEHAFTAETSKGLMEL